jgi:hypothetical protein
MAKIEDRAIYLSANGLNKTLEQAIIDGDIGAGGVGAGSSTEVFNSEIFVGAEAASLTGLSHFRAPSSKTISSVVVTLYEMNGISSGVLEIDIKLNSTPDDVGMTSIFSTLPSFDFSTSANYDTSNGVRSTSSVPSGNFLRLDITSIPSGWRGVVHVSCYA